MNSDESSTSLLSADIDRVGSAVVARDGLLYAVAGYAHFAKALTQVQVEDAIAAMLRARGLSIAQNRQDARLRCAGRTMLSVTPAYSLILQSADLSNLAEALDKALPQAHYVKAAVGSCPTQGQEGSFTAYRVAVLLY